MTVAIKAVAVAAGDTEVGHSIRNSERDALRQPGKSVSNDRPSSAELRAHRAAGEGTTKGSRLP